MDIIDGLSSSEQWDVETCNLGPDDEYYLALNNGRQFWRGSHAMKDDLARVKNRVTGIVFGDGGTYFARYE